MKLQNDKGLIQRLQNENMIPSAVVAKEFLHEIDQYLEEHGFHIYPVKKEKPLPFANEKQEEWVRMYKEVLFRKFNNGDKVMITDETHERFGKAAKVVDYNSFAAKIEFPDGTREIIMWEFLELFRFEKPKNKLAKNINKLKVGDKVFVTEEKPSADGEENLYAGFFSPMGVDWKKICFPNEKAVQFTPFQCCPVCQGEGEIVNFKFGTVDGAGHFLNTPFKKQCPCCEGAMVIPMKREERK